MTGMQVLRGSTIVAVPAGTYWLGDPCYSVKEEDWIPWLEAADYTNSQDVLCAQTPGADGAWVLGLGTAYGDGVYVDQYDNEYGVDAGLIGLVPVWYNPTTNYTLDENGINEYGASGIARQITFAVRTQCWNDNGVLHFGDIVINTRDDADDDDEGDDE
jgi:hypothetical protein